MTEQKKEINRFAVQRCVHCCSAVIFRKFVLSLIKFLVRF